MFSITLLYLLVLKPQLFKASRNSDCFLKILFSKNPKVYAIKCKGIFFVSFGSFCLSDPDAAFLGFAKLSFNLIKSFFL